METEAAVSTGRRRRRRMIYLGVGLLRRKCRYILQVIASIQIQCKIPQTSMSIPQRIILLALLATAVIAGQTEKKVEINDSKPKRGLEHGLGDLGGHGGLGGLGGDLEGLSLGGGLGGGLAAVAGGAGGDRGRISGITIHREVAVPVPAPYVVERRVPVPVEVPVKVPVDNPIPYHVPAPYPVPVEKKVYVAVEKNVGVPYSVPVKVPYKVAVPVEREIPVPVFVKGHAGHGSSWAGLGGYGGGFELSGLHH
ncbi:probable H/ACA ribonucleoprotein complex subunit 1 [Belonocnema kinseyi]|uniref:probable H/ACA ribonucleoprotein complex subunit 1 n=1 Tax=Belonocnema kinseyi TaxID=2817044 RepID=UPI00143DFDAD|nr:probable H/ACA ribonucleoprotein complex subunit 1 [Belonocnema kinseyi]